MNFDEFVDDLCTPVVQIGLIIGLAEIMKSLGIDAKFIPLVDLVLGLISGILVYGLEYGYGIFKGSIIGLALGLQACGLFSGFKNMIH